MPRNRGPGQRACFPRLPQETDAETGTQERGPRDEGPGEGSDTATAEDAGAAATTRSSRGLKGAPQGARCRGRPSTRPPGPALGESGVLWVKPPSLWPLVTAALGH